MLSQISRDQYYCKVTAEKIRLFGLWYDTMILSNQDNGDENEDTPSKRACLAQRSKKIAFGADEELPILRASFQVQSHPSTQSMIELAGELNKTEFRKSLGREKVDFRHVNNWFKNERARVRKLSQEYSQVKYRTEYSMVGTATEVESELGAEESEESEVF